MYITKCVRFCAPPVLSRQFRFVLLKYCPCLRPRWRAGPKFLTFPFGGGRIAKEWHASPPSSNETFSTLCINIETEENVFFDLNISFWNVIFSTARACKFY